MFYPDFGYDSNEFYYSAILSFFVIVCCIRWILTWVFPKKIYPSLFFTLCQLFLLFLLGLPIWNFDSFYYGFRLFRGNGFEFSRNTFKAKTSSYTFLIWKSFRFRFFKYFHFLRIRF
ncbi:hypothetical protein LEP1GSC037_3492 [Leptospira interrogans str. 2006001854]|uniref:Uncharacterized protein n=1 Tax=Leptospira interrogans str. 2006001854 TaxID=1001590 RepID=M6G9G8_LEPIR|nr:hypothetical protein LEP1GSC037_3492 [Leptospira interrogans str. 2006001854]